MLSFFNRLKWFPISQIVCMIPSTISRMYSVFDLEPNMVLTISQTIFGSILGVLYFIIYIRIPHVKHSLKVFYYKLIKKENEDLNNIILDNSQEKIDCRLLYESA
jgi:hypothetical protein